MRLPWGEVFVLGDAGVGHVHVAVVHHRRALIIAVGHKALEIEGTVAEAPQLVVKVAIERTGVEGVRVGGAVGAVKVGVEAQVNRRMVKHRRDNRGVAVFRHPLKLVEEVVVVVVETHRQAFEDAGRQFARLAAPLFLRIALEEGLIKRAADEFQRLLLKVLRFGNAAVCLLTDEGARFIRTQRLAEELVDGVQIDRQRVHLSVHRAFDAVHIRHHLAETLHQRPHLGVVGMENVRSIDVHHHTGFAVAGAVAITGDVFAAFDDVYRVSGFSQGAGNDSAGKTGANHEDFFFHG